MIENIHFRRKAPSLKLHLWPTVLESMSETSIHSRESRLNTVLSLLLGGLDILEFQAQILLQLIYVGYC